MSLELVKSLFDKHPDFASLYIQCVEDYNANMDDVRLVLSSLPKDFPEEEILKLYLFADKQKIDPDYEISAQLKELNLGNSETIEFVPQYNHNINAIIRNKLSSASEELSDDEAWLSQYGNARLFRDKIISARDDLFSGYKTRLEALQQEARKKEAELKSFVSDFQSSHESKINKSVNTSFDKLRFSYPNCDVRKNIQEIKKFIADLPEKSVSKKNKTLAKNLISQMEYNSNYSEAKKILAHIWEAIKDGKKLNNKGVNVNNIELLQQNLRESVITQLASIETNYSVEGKSYAGGSRSCPGGTKNAIVQILDGYHEDVNIGYRFKGKDQAALLDADSAQTKYKELFLEQLSKIDAETREKIIKNWDPDSSMVNQVQLEDNQRLIILDVARKVEIQLLKEYSTSQAEWFSSFKPVIEQSASLSGLSLLKPEFDLLYEYKQLLRSKKLSYQATIDAIKAGGKLDYLPELMMKIKEKNLNFSEDVLKELILKIDKKDLDSLREDILKDEYKIIEQNFEKSSATKKIDIILEPDEFLIGFISNKEAVLKEHLRERFTKLASAEYNPILIKKFKDERFKEEVAKAMFNGSFTDIDKADLKFIEEVYEYQNKKLLSGLEKLQNIKPKTQEISKQIDDIANQQQNASNVLAKKYFSVALKFIEKKQFDKFDFFITDLRKNNPEIFKLTCEQQDAQGQTLLYLALDKELAGESIDQLINSKANLNIQDQHDNTALHMAIWKAHEEQAEKLIEAGANLNIKNNNGHTALHAAISYGRKDIAAKIIDQGADLNIKNNNGDIALHLAISKGYKDIAEKLIAKGADLNIRNNDGDTALHLAASCGYEDIVEKIIETGIDLNVKGSNGETALHMAFYKEHEGIAAKLIDQGAELDLQDNFDNTALHIAIWRGYKNIASELIVKGADLNIRNDHGETVLYTAIFSGHKDIAEKLIEKGADLNIADKNGKTVLRLATEFGDIEIVKKILVKQATIEANDLNSMLHGACNRGRSEVAIALIRAGADPTKTIDNKLPKGLEKNDEVIQFFKDAIKSKDIELVKKLAEYYGKLKGTYLSNFTGRTLVSYAMKKESPEIAAYLLQEGFVPQKTWAEYFTAMLYPKAAKEKYALENKLDSKTLAEYKKLVSPDLINSLNGVRSTSRASVDRITRHSTERRSVDTARE